MHEHNAHHGAENDGFTGRVFLPQPVLRLSLALVLPDSPLSTLAQRTLAPALPTMPAASTRSRATGVKP